MNKAKHKLAALGLLVALVWIPGKASAAQCGSSWVRNVEEAICL
jgi:hypothetical protein